MSLHRGLLEIVVGRLGSADSTMVLNSYVGGSDDFAAHNLIVSISMMLINSLLSHATDASWKDLTSELERLNIRKAVVVC